MKKSCLRLISRNGRIGRSGARSSSARSATVSGDIHPTAWDWADEKVLRPEKTIVASEGLKAAEHLKADLIVVATEGKGAVARMVLGSVAQQVLKDAPCNVLAILPDAA